MIKELTTQDYIKLENELGAQTYSPLDLVIERAEGVWLWDVEGRKYLDCTSAYSSVNLGHCHPELLKVFVEQAGKVTQVSRALRNTKMPVLFEKLTKLTGINNVLPMNTG
ncbi:MAG: aminotransferase class III-fold pyridoxal phosphate-dependent enzyme, partial [Candidatus Gastranaerophilales bacterium]|nr:aminotransferase class III-fold pyridoxal phosphate-dependent enzyme [Candidatus Gastranaerophilales bacterium]